MLRNTAVGECSERRQSVRRYDRDSTVNASAVSAAVKTLRYRAPSLDSWVAQLVVPDLLQWPVVDDGDALVIDDLACSR
jgi:hypothetical protein